MKKIILNLILVLILCCNFVEKQPSNSDCDYPFELIQKFKNDTSDINTLKKCDSILLKCFNNDSTKVNTLIYLGFTRFYLQDFNFVLNRILPKLYLDEGLLLYEKHKIFEAMNDSINYCSSLIKAELLLKSTNFNDEENFVLLMAYLDILYILYGENHANKFFIENIIPDSLPNTSNVFFEKPLSPIIKAHKNGFKYKCN
jgi:hypothetical protein